MMIEEKNWQDVEPKDNIHYAVEEIAPAFREQKLEESKEKHQQKKDFFKLFKIFITLMFVAAYSFMGFTLTHPNTPSVIISSLAAMIPMILSLAMMRFLFGDKLDKETKNIPSVAFNLIKEIKEVFSLYLKSKK